VISCLQFKSNSNLKKDYSSLYTMNLVIALLFIIIVYVAITFYNVNDPFITSGLVCVGLGFLVMLFMNPNSEEGLVGGFSGGLRTPDGDMTNSDGLNYEPDRPEFAHISKNFSMPVGQDERDYDFSKPNEGRNDDEMDNGDVVTQFITGGANTYIPQEVHSDNYYQVADLAYPKKPGQEIGDGSDLLYGQMVPLNEGAISNDDKLSRAQIHRSMMNKRATDGAVRATRNQFDKYFVNEFAEAEASEWWNNQADENETEYFYGK